MQPVEKHATKTPICLFCYHKVGTSLFSKIFREICAEFNWRFKSLVGIQSHIPEDADVILYAHSLVDFSQIKQPFIGIHLTRDPRDIIVSGYLYHRRTSEKWCTNQDFSLTPPIRFPQVPWSQQHRTEEWKVHYLQSLNGMSYQDNLLNLSQHDGLFFEINNYGAWTIESIKNWDYNQKNILEIKFENLMSHYDDNFKRIFEHIGLSATEIASCMRIAQSHDLGRMSAKEIEQMEHVSSAKTSRWKDYFGMAHKAYFVAKFGNLLIDLEYEESNDW